MTTQQNDELTGNVKRKAAEFGADAVGVAPVERFKNAPLRMSPQGLMPGAKSVVVAGIHHLDAVIELDAEPSPQDIHPYHTQGCMNEKLDDISFKLARFIEQAGFAALPIVSTNLWRYKGYKDIGVDFAPDLVHRYAAVAAGLGEIGWNGLLLHPEFGPRMRVVSVVTDAPLVPSPIYEGEPLCDRCMECVKRCPTDAFRKEVRKINELEIGGRLFKFPDINKWRCAWAENFALNLQLPIPDKVDEQAILEYLEKYGQRGGEQGSCLKFCMNPQKRVRDPAYSRAPRRRKTPAGFTPRQITTRLKNMFKAGRLDILAAAGAQAFAENAGCRPALHLPDFKSALVLGLRMPGGVNSEFQHAGRRRVWHCAFDIARWLDVNGYSAATYTRISDIQVARQLGVYRQDHIWSTVLTSAELPALKLSARKPARKNVRPETVLRMGRDAGADLVGHFSAERFARFRKSSLGLDKTGTRDVVFDAMGASGWYGAYIPAFREETFGMRPPGDFLPGARSVIVLGIHIPHASFDFAKVTPAETVGPFSFAQFEALNLLGDAAFSVVRDLESAGWRAVMLRDFDCLASSTTSSRGPIVDARANAWAAALAGLGVMGAHGHLLTPQYGARQRFISIVTDCPLPDSPLSSMPNPCDKCGKLCIEACPTHAISDRAKKAKLDSLDLTRNNLDAFACDWAKRYALSAEEGPKYIGLDVDAPMPKTKTSQALAKAAGAASWGVQKRLVDVAPECLRVCPAHALGASAQIKTNK